MTDVIRVEGLGKISLFDLVDRLSAPQSLEDDKTSEKSAPSSSKKVSKEKKLSSAKKILDCPIEGCNRSFCKESALQNHIKRHNRLFKCDQCDKTFTEQAKLKRHHLVHTGERRFECPFENCGRRFSLAFNLTTHMRIHTGDKPFKCDTCGKSFAQSANLKQHKKTHQANNNDLHQNSQVNPGAVL